MRIVHDLKIYDTDKSELLYQWENTSNYDDFGYIGQELYITDKGSLFVIHETHGSHASEMTVLPMSVREAAEWLEKRGGQEVLLNNEAFLEVLGEA